MLITSDKKMPKTEETFRELTLHDMCDKCGFRAKCRAHKKDLELFFCGHHANSYFDSLTDQGFYIYMPAEVVKEEEIDLDDM